MNRSMDDHKAQLKELKRQRNAVNAFLSQLGKTYHEDLETVRAAIKEHLKWSGFIVQSGDMVMDIQGGRPRDRSWSLWFGEGPVPHNLVFSWYQHETGKYEITAYIS